MANQLSKFGMLGIPVLQGSVKENHLGAMTQYLNPIIKGE